MKYKAGRKRKSEQKISFEYISSSESESENEGSKKKKLKKRDSNTSKKKNELNNEESNENNQKKKMQNPNTLLKQMVPSPKELAYRSRRSENVNESTFEFLCTKCGIDLDSLTDEKRSITCHPLLDVLMCQECCEYYGDGDFSLDSDDEDKYCRWCGEGGTIFACSKCICGFCRKCIENHFGKEEVKKVQKEDNWLCYFCNPKPLWNLRYICSLAKKKFSKKKERTHSNHLISEKKLDKTSKEEMKTKKNSLATENNNSSTSCSENASENENETEDKSNHKEDKSEKQNDSDEDSDCDDDEPIKKKSKKNSETAEIETESKNSEDLMESNAKYEELEDENPKLEQILEKFENILKLTENQMSFGKCWSTKKLKFLKNEKLLKRPKNLLKECRKVKWFISLLASHLTGFVNSVELLEKELKQKENESVEEDKEQRNETSSSRPSLAYDIILKFINFMQNQVNTFDQKGVDFEDLIESEIYENEYVLGLGKKNWRKKKKISEPKVSNVLPEEDKVVVEEKESTPLNDAGSNREGDESSDNHFTPFKDEEIENIVTILKED